MKKLTIIIICLIALFSFTTPAHAGIDFDGVDDHVNCGSGSSLRPASFTISLWTKKTADIPGAKMTLLEVPYNNEASAPYATYAVLYDRADNNELELFLGFPDGTWANCITTDGTLTAGQWHHVVCVFDDANDNAKVYRDNVIKYDDTQTQSVKYYGSDSLFLAAGGLPVTPEWYYGVIDEVAIWNTPLSADEITILYGSGSARRGTPLGVRAANLAGYWSLDDGADGTSADGDTAVDRSGNGNHGTGSDGSNDTGCLWETDTALLDWPGVKIGQ